MRATISAVAMLALGGCASVTRGVNEQVQFDSDPPGAEMRSVIYSPCGGPCPEGYSPATGQYRTEAQMQTLPVAGPACITPCVAAVSRNDELIVTFSKAGYRPVTVPLKRQVSGGGAAGVAGNILAGGLVGIAVDAGTGAGTDHVPNPLKVKLVPDRPERRG